jgi:hypothetical protein
MCGFYRAGRMAGVLVDVLTNTDCEAPHSLLL